ncbi:MAG: hypothetical protein WC763_06875, partial [Candidatus Paceibacterota bacterium]
NAHSHAFYGCYYLPQKVKRVLTEREVLATTTHPLIISLYCSFQSRSRLYFVMDYCAGGEFYRTIQVRKRVHGRRA